MNSDDDSTFSFMCAQGNPEILAILNEASSLQDPSTVVLGEEVQVAAENNGTTIYLTEEHTISSHFTEAFEEQKSELQSVNFSTFNGGSSLKPSQELLVHDNSKLATLPEVYVGVKPITDDLISSEQNTICDNDLVPHLEEVEVTTCLDVLCDSLERTQCVMADIERASKDQLLPNDSLNTTVMTDNVDDILKSAVQSDLEKCVLLSNTDNDVMMCTDNNEDPDKSIVSSGTNSNEDLEKSRVTASDKMTSNQQTCTGRSEDLEKSGVPSGTDKSKKCDLQSNPDVKKSDPKSIETIEKSDLQNDANDNSAIEKGDNIRSGPDDSEISEKTNLRSDAVSNETTEKSELRKHQDDNEATGTFEVRKDPDDNEKSDLQGDPDVNVVIEKLDLQSDSDVNIVIEKLGLQSNPDANVVIEKLDLQSNPDDNMIIEKSDSQSSPDVKEATEQSNLQSNPEDNVVIEKSDLPNNANVNVVVEKSDSQNSPDDNEAIEKSDVRKDLDDNETLNKSDMEDGKSAMPSSDIMEMHGVEKVSGADHHDDSIKVTTEVVLSSDEFLVSETNITADTSSVQIDIDDTKTCKLSDTVLEVSPQDVRSEKCYSDEFVKQTSDVGECNDKSLNEQIRDPPSKKIEGKSSIKEVNGAETKVEGESIEKPSTHGTEQVTAVVIVEESVADGAEKNVSVCVVQEESIIQSDRKSSTHGGNAEIHINKARKLAETHPMDKSNIVVSDSATLDDTKSSTCKTLQDADNSVSTKSTKSIGQIVAISGEVHNVQSASSKVKPGIPFTVHSKANALQKSSQQIHVQKSSQQIHVSGKPNIIRKPSIQQSSPARFGQKMPPSKLICGVASVNTAGKQGNTKTPLDTPGKQHIGKTENLTPICIVNLGNKLDPKEKESIQKTSVKMNEATSGEVLVQQVSLHKNQGKTSDHHVSWNKSHAPIKKIYVERRSQDKNLADRKTVQRVRAEAISNLMKSNMKLVSPTRSLLQLVRPEGSSPLCTGKKSTNLSLSIEKLDAKSNKDKLINTSDWSYKREKLKSPVVSPQKAFPKIQLGVKLSSEHKIGPQRAEVLEPPSLSLKQAKSADSVLKEYDVSSVKENNVSTDVPANDSTSLTVANDNSILEPEISLVKLFEGTVCDDSPTKSISSEPVEDLLRLLEDSPSNQSQVKTDAETAEETQLEIPKRKSSTERQQEQNNERTSRLKLKKVNDTVQRILAEAAKRKKPRRFPQKQRTSAEKELQKLQRMQRYLKRKVTEVDDDEEDLKNVAAPVAKEVKVAKKNKEQTSVKHYPGQAKNNNSAPAKLLDLKTKETNVQIMVEKANMARKTRLAKLTASEINLENVSSAMNLYAIQGKKRKLPSSEKGNKKLKNSVSNEYAEKKTESSECENSLQKTSRSTRAQKRKLEEDEAEKLPQSEPKTPTVKSNKSPVDKEVIVPDSGLQINVLAPPVFTYEELKDNVSQVKLPSTLWATQVETTGRFVSFSRMASNSSKNHVAMDKAVLFFNSCEPAVFFNGKLVFLPVEAGDLKSLEAISEFIMMVHRVAFCVGTGLEEPSFASDCWGYVDMPNAEHRCSLCHAVRRRTLLMKSKLGAKKTFG